MIQLTQALRSFIVGKGSITDFGDRYPVLDRRNMSSIAGLYIVGNIAGTPDIRAAINAGHDIGSLLGRSDGLPENIEQADYDVVCH